VEINKIRRYLCDDMGILFRNLPRIFINEGYIIDIQYENMIDSKCTEKDDDFHGKNMVISMIFV